MSFLYSKSSRIKNILFKVLAVFLATSITLVVVNFILFRFSQNQNLPRPFASSIGNYIFTYYPDTYNRSTLNNYDAILGDSNAMGSGDSYLNNDYNYSIGHLLFKNLNKNYLTYARPGYGSISAVSNYIKLNKLEDYIFFKKRINKPSTIYFFFMKETI